MKNEVATKFLCRSPQGPGGWRVFLAFEFVMVLGLATEGATVGAYEWPLAAGSMLHK